MEPFISMIATDSTYQFYFFKMLRHQVREHQWKEKGWSKVLKSIYNSSV